MSKATKANSDLPQKAKEQIVKETTGKLVATIEQYSSSPKSPGVDAPSYPMLRLR